MTLSLMTVVPMTVSPNHRRHSCCHYRRHCWRQEWALYQNCDSYCRRRRWPTAGWCWIDWMGCSLEGSDWDRGWSDCDSIVIGYSIEPINSLIIHLFVCYILLQLWYTLMYPFFACAVHRCFVGKIKNKLYQKRKRTQSSLHNTIKTNKIKNNKLTLKRP